MQPLLIQLHKVLTSDTSLTALVPSDNIGAIIRQNAGSPVLEYGIDGEEANYSGHRTLTLAFVIASQTGAESTYAIKERLEALMTAKNLSTPIAPPPPALPVALVFKAVQVKLTDSRVYPRTGWAHAIRVEFDIMVADTRPPTQKQ
jgi:hypothetical protein